MVYNIFKKKKKKNRIRFHENKLVLILPETMTECMIIEPIIVFKDKYNMSCRD